MFSSTKISSAICQKCKGISLVEFLFVVTPTKYIWLDSSWREENIKSFTFYGSLIVKGSPRGYENQLIGRHKTNKPYTYT